MTAINTNPANVDPGLKPRAEVRDLLMDTLLAVLSANLRFALNTPWSQRLSVVPGGGPEDVVARTYAYPVSLSVVPSTQLPALCAWRARSRYMRQGKRNHRRYTIGIRYWMDQVPIDHMENRWPLLNEVFEVIVETLAGRTKLDVTVAGEIDTFPSTDVLRLAGLVTVDEESIEATVDFATLSGGDVGFAIPVMDITFTMDAEAKDGPFSQSADELNELTQLVLALTDARPPAELNPGECGLNDGHRTLVEILVIRPEAEPGDEA